MAPPTWLVSNFLVRPASPCSDSSATPCFPSQPEGKIGLPMANPRGRRRSPSFERVLVLPLLELPTQTPETTSRSLHQLPELMEQGCPQTLLHSPSHPPMPSGLDPQTLPGLLQHGSVRWAQEGPPPPSPSSRADKTLLPRSKTSPGARLKIWSTTALIW